MRHALRTFVVALAGLVVGGCTGIELGAVGVAALLAILGLSAGRTVIAQARAELQA